MIAEFDTDLRMRKLNRSKIKVCFLDAAEERLELANQFSYHFSMKVLIILIWLLSMTAEASLDIQSKLRQSQKSWQAWRDENKNSYVIREVYRSVFGSSSISATYVRDGVVQQLKSCSYDSEEALRPVKSSIGKNDFAVGKVPPTMDEIYKYCYDNVLKRIEQNIDSPRLVFSERGMLKECSFHPENCQDDCRQGHEIAVLEAIETHETLDEEICPEITSVYFDKGSHKLSDVAKKELKKAVDSFKTFPVALLIEGHADRRGGLYRNLELGEKRALAVKSFLVSSGLSEKKVAIVSYGYEKPVDLGKGEESHAKNRRAKLLPLIGTL